MRLFRQFKREVCCADLRFILLFALVSLVLGTLSALLGGGHSRCFTVCMPSFAPSHFCLWVIWTFFFLLIGGAAGLVFSSGRCGRIKLGHRGLVWWAVGLLLGLLWFPLFFGAGHLLLSLFLVPLMIVVALLTCASFARSSLLSALVMALYALWLFFCFFLQVAVILCN